MVISGPRPILYIFVYSMLSHANDLKVVGYYVDERIIQPLGNY